MLPSGPAPGLFVEKIKSGKSEDRLSLPGELPEDSPSLGKSGKSFSPESSSSVYFSETIGQAINHTLSKQLTKLCEGIKEDIREELRKGLQGGLQRQTSAEDSSPPFVRQASVGLLSRSGTSGDLGAPAWQSTREGLGSAGGLGLTRPTRRNSRDKVVSRRQSVVAEFLNLRYDGQSRTGQSRNAPSSSCTSGVTSPLPDQEFAPTTSKSLPPATSTIARKLDNILESFHKKGSVMSDPTVKDGNTSARGSIVSLRSSIPEEQTKERLRSQLNKRPDSESDNFVDVKVMPTTPTELSKKNGLKPHSAEYESSWEPMVSDMSADTEPFVKSFSVGVGYISEGVEEPPTPLMASEAEESAKPEDLSPRSALLPRPFTADSSASAATSQVQNPNRRMSNASSSKTFQGVESINSTDLTGFHKRPSALRRTHTTTNLLNPGSLTSVTACMHALESTPSFASAIPERVGTGNNSRNSEELTPVNSDSRASLESGISPNTSFTTKAEMMNHHNSRSSAFSASRGRRSGISGMSRNPTRDTEMQVSRCEQIYGPIVYVAGHKRFDYFMGALILLNAATIGIQIDYMAKEATKVIPRSFRVLEVVFGIIYAVELPLRFIVQKRAFFCGPAWRWNLFDIFLVTSQLMEELLSAIEPDQETTSKFFNVVRGMRILRLLRMFRVVSVLRPINELNMIIKAILGSFRSLFWTIVLLFFIIYIIGVYLTQLVSDYMIEQITVNTETEENMQLYFGGVLRSILSLYQAMAGGIDWDFLSAPLMEHISPWLGVLFSFYIAFAVLALMNIVTGVFVQSALNDARESDDAELVMLMESQFKRIDVDNTGIVGREEFEAHIGAGSMRNYLKKLNLDLNEAMDLFHILDTDGSGDVSYEEFAQGCLKLRKNAKAIDLVALMQHSRRSFDELGADVEQMLNVIDGKLHQVMDLMIKANKSETDEE